MIEGFRIDVTADELVAHLDRRITTAIGRMNATRSCSGFGRSRRRQMRKKKRSTCAARHGSTDWSG